LEQLAIKNGEKNADKRLWFGMPVLVFTMTVVGCGFPEDEDIKGYMFEFKIRNESAADTIDKIEFINGDRENDPVLQTHNINIPYGETSEIFKVSGFNKADFYADVLESRKNFIYIGVQTYFEGT
jgi:hypothetical protein